MGRERPQEHLPTVSGGASPPQVAGDRFADIGGQREPVLAAALAVDHDFSPPANRCRQGSARPTSTGSQTQPQQHDQDRVIPPPIRSAAIA